MFELYEMFPEYFGRIKLPLPEDEAKSKIPHILADAVWMLDGFKRLQLPDGGVRGGYGDGWGQGGPFENMASWDIKCVLVYGATTPTTYYYAACAARARGYWFPSTPSGPPAIGSRPCALGLGGEDHPRTRCEGRLGGSMQQTACRHPVVPAHRRGTFQG